MTKKFEMESFLFCTCIVLLILLFIAVPVGATSCDNAENLTAQLNELQDNPQCGTSHEAQPLKCETAYEAQILKCVTAKKTRNSHSKQLNCYCVTREGIELEFIYNKAKNLASRKNAERLNLEIQTIQATDIP